MDSKQLLTYISAPENNNQESLEAIQKLLDEYPFFQTAYSLKLKHLKRFYHSRYEMELPKSVVHIPDREILFNYLSEDIKQNVKDIVVQEKPERKNFTDNLKDNISSVLEGEIEFIQKPYSEKVDVIIEPGDVNIPVRDTEILDIEENGELENKIHKKDEPKNEKCNSKELNNQLIDNFLAKEPRIIPQKDLDNEIEDVSLSSIQEDEGILTETLAKVYINQGYYDKAIRTYEKLILKYPEKSTYFASQIEEIKKINH